MSQRICECPLEVSAEYFSYFHDYLFGSSTEFISAQKLKSRVTSVYHELGIKAHKISSRKKVPPFSPLYLCETCLLLGDLLISVEVNEDKPSIPFYISRLEDVLLPQLFLRTKVSPAHLRFNLLTAPISVFTKFSSVPESRNDAYFMELVDSLRILKMNFGLDLLDSLGSSQLPPRGMEVQPPYAIPQEPKHPHLSESSGMVGAHNDTSSMMKKRRKESLLSGGTAKEGQSVGHSIPSYLLKRKRRDPIPLAGSSREQPPVSRLRVSDMEELEGTPDNSETDDNEILAGETPEKRRMLH